MKGAQGVVTGTISETERTHTRIMDVLTDCHGAVNDLESKLHPVLTPSGPDEAQNEEIVPPSTPRHAALQSYATGLADLRRKLLALASRIEV